MNEPMQQDGAATPVPPQPLPAKRRFPGLRDRARRSIVRYRKRPFTLFALSVLHMVFPSATAVVAAFGLGFAAAVLPGGRAIWPLIAVFSVLLLVVVAITLTLWIALMSTAAFSTPFFSSLRNAFHYLVPFVAASVLATLAMWTGFLLLLVPGIIMGFYFALVGPVVITERRTGLDALVRSRDLMRGRTFDIFVGLLILGIILGILSWLLDISLGAALAAVLPEPVVALRIHHAIATTFAAALFLPVGVIYIQLFYEDAAALDTVEWAPNLKTRKLYTIMAIIGVLVFFAAAASAGVAVWSRSGRGVQGQPSDAAQQDGNTRGNQAEAAVDPAIERDTARYRDLTALRVGLASYTARNDGSYPDALEALIPAYIDAVSKDPLSGAPYAYERTPYDYILRFTLEEGVFTLAPGEHTLSREGFDATVSEEAPPEAPPTSTTTVSEAVPASPDTEPPPVQGIDADDDGLADEYERSRGLDPFSTDSDKDGIPDGIEVRQVLSDPAKTDTDLDGFADGDELIAGFDPLQAGAVLPDLDNDGLADLYEEIHALDGGDPDSDDDGLSDGDELRVFGTDLAVADTDSDGFSDATELSGGFEPLGEGPLTQFRRSEIAAAKARFGTHPPTDPAL